MSNRIVTNGGSSVSSRSLKQDQTNNILTGRRPWVRNPSWPTLPTVLSTDNKVVGLVKVFNGSTDANGIAFIISGAYTVDWGDGNVENVATGVRAQHLYDYNNSNLANTNAPVTFQDAGDTVIRNSHGYQEGMQVTFFSITSTTGISINVPYYIINVTTNTFQLSTTYNGSAIALTTDGSGILLNYKLSIVTITPQSGQTLTQLNFLQFYGGVSLNANIPWAELIISAPSATLCAVGSGTSVQYYSDLEQLTILSSGTSSMSAIGSNMPNLYSVPYIGNARNPSLLDYAFTGSRKLEYVGTFNLTFPPTSVTFMFEKCYALITAPYFDTSAVTNFTAMFNGCYSLKNVPNYNTASGTNFTIMFQNCTSLVNSPKLSLSGNTSNMFVGCSALKYVPNMSTSTVTNTSTMFQNCYSLESVPDFDLSATTNTSYMFQNCYSLRSFNGNMNMPNNTNTSDMFDTCSTLSYVSPIVFKTGNSVVTTTSMFFACYALQFAPNITNPSASNGLTSMFYSCIGIPEIPAWDLSGAGNISNAFSYMYDLVSFKATGMKWNADFTYCRLSKTAIESICNTGLGTSASGSGTLTITQCPGSTLNPAVTTTITATAKALTGTVASSVGLVNGMLMSGSSLNTWTTATSMATTVSTSIITWTGHNFSNGTIISFKTIGTTTGVVINTVYYIVNVTTDTFQVSATSGGSPITFTGTSSTVTMVWPQYITSIVGTTITFSAPFGNTGTTISSSFRNLDTAQAYLKGFTTVSY